MTIITLKNHLFVPLLRNLKYIYFYDVSGGQDKYYAIKTKCTSSVCFIPIFTCVINIFYLLRVDTNFLPEDLVESFAAFCSVGTITYVKIFIEFHINVVDNFIHLASDFEQFGTPKYVTTVVRITLICSRIVYIIVTCVILMYIYYGFTTASECLRLNMEYDLVRTCGLPIPVLFADLTGWTRIVAFFMLSIGIAVPIISCVAGLIVMIAGFELIICRYKHLKDMLLNLKGDKLKPGFVEDFKKCCAYHSYILDKITKLNAETQNIIVVFFLASSIIISIVGYQTMITKEKLPGALAHLVTWIAAVFAICFAGQRVTNENTSLEYEFYDILWYRKEFIPYRKDLLLMILRGQKATGILAGAVGYIQLQNFAQIMKGAYSYLTMLLSTT